MKRNSTNSRLYTDTVIKFLIEEVKGLIGVGDGVLREALHKEDESAAVEFVLEPLVASDKFKGKQYEDVARRVNLAETGIAMMYSYSRMLHFQVDAVPKYGAPDIKVLEAFGDDCSFDIKYEHNGKKYTIATIVNKRIYPIKIAQRAELFWTIEMFMLREGSREIVSNTKIHLGWYRERLTAVVEYMEIFEGITRMHARANFDGTNGYCDKCNGCFRVNCSYFDFEDRLPKVLMDEARACRAHESSEVAMPPLYGVLCAITHTLKCYMNRGQITRKNGRVAREYNQCKIHMMSKTSNGNTVALLPLHDIVKEYKESHKEEYKGGHHQSPVAHVRRSHFRRVKKGNYIMVNGQFVEVEAGKGQFTLVKGSHVNVGSERKKVHRMTEEELNKHQ